MAKKLAKRPLPKASKSAKPAPSKASGKQAAKPSAGKAKPTAKNNVVKKPAATAKTAVAKPAIAKQPAKNSPAPKKAVETKPAAKSAAPAPAPAKPSNGRPMLIQGPIAARPLTKRGTFAVPLTPAKPAPKPVKKKREDKLEPQFVVVQPPVAAVASSEKAVKNKAGLNQRDIEHYRELLLAKRRELVGDMSHMEREALRENNANLSNLPVHMADQGTDAYEQEFTLGLVEKDRILLREINDALAKTQNGTYGICEGTGNPIGQPRLEAQPWARHSIEYARQLEKRQMVNFRR